MNTTTDLVDTGPVLAAQNTQIWLATLSINTAATSAPNGGSACVIFAPIGYRL